MNTNNAFNTVYYRLRPLIPRRLQILMRSALVRRKRKKFKKSWPIFEAAGRQPINWPGWPEHKRIALVLTHDIESSRGVAYCKKLARLEMDLGFRSSFNFVARRYPIPETLPVELTQMGLRSRCPWCLP